MAMLAKYDEVHPKFRPYIPFTQLKECKNHYQEVVSHSLGEGLYYVDGKFGLVYSSYFNKGKEILTSVRPANRTEILGVAPLSHLRSSDGFYYCGVGGISRRGISYSSLKSNPYITIPVEKYFANNTYTYSLSEGKKGSVTRAPYMLRDEDLVTKTRGYKVHVSYVLPSSAAWEALFEAIYDDQLSKLARDDEVARINVAMAYLLTPLLYVRMALDCAVRLEIGWDEGFMSYVLNERYEELLENCSPIANSANSKIELWFDRVYGASTGKVAEFNDYYKEVHKKFIDASLANARNQNLA